MQLRETRGRGGLGAAQLLGGLVARPLLVGGARRRLRRGAFAGRVLGRAEFLKARRGRGFRLPQRRGRRRAQALVLEAHLVRLGPDPRPGVLLGGRDARRRGFLRVLQVPEPLRRRVLGRRFFGRAARLEFGLGPLARVLLLDAEGLDAFRGRQRRGLDARLPFPPLLVSRGPALLLDFVGLDLGRAGLRHRLRADRGGAGLGYFRRALRMDAPRLGRRNSLAPLVVLLLDEVVPRLDPQLHDDEPRGHAPSQLLDRARADVGPQAPDARDRVPPPLVPHGLVVRQDGHGPAREREPRAPVPPRRLGHLERKRGPHEALQRQRGPAPLAHRGPRQPAAPQGLDRARRAPLLAQLARAGAAPLEEERAQRPQ